MRMVSIYDLRSKLAEYLSSVADTQTPVVIRRFGKPIAMIVPFDKKKISFEKYFGFLGKGETGEAFVNRVRRSHRERTAIQARRGEA